MKPPPSAPTSPIIEPATAVVSGQRSGTSWNSAPLPAPRPAKQSMKSSVVAASEPPLIPHSVSVAATATSTPESVLTPPMRSEIQPPTTRTAEPISVASMVSWPASTLVTLNWS